MTTAIAVIWWIGLIGALGATLTILKEVVLVLRTLGEILRLAERTRDAARGIHANLTPAARLAELPPAVRALRDAAASLLRAAEPLERHHRRLGGGKATPA